MSATRALAAIAAAAALLAAVASGPHVPAGSGPRGEVPAAVGGGASRATDADGTYDIGALELAQWIRDGREVTVLDLRSAAAYDEFAVPTATQVTIAQLADMPLARADTVVLYGDDGPTVLQGWTLLRARRLEHAYVLEGGMYEWLRAVLNPALPLDATPAEEAAFAEVAQLSRYFGGVPRRGEPEPAFRRAGTDSTSAQARDAMSSILRRGCE